MYVHAYVIVQQKLYFSMQTIYRILEVHKNLKLVAIMHVAHLMLIHFTHKQVHLESKCAIAFVHKTPFVKHPLCNTHSIKSIVGCFVYLRGADQPEANIVLLNSLKEHLMLM